MDDKGKINRVDGNEKATEMRIPAKETSIEEIIPDTKNKKRPNMALVVAIAAVFLSVAGLVIDAIYFFPKPKLSVTKPFLVSYPYTYLKENIDAKEYSIFFQIINERRLRTAITGISFCVYDTSGQELLCNVELKEGTGEIEAFDQKIGEILFSVLNDDSGFIEIRKLRKGLLEPKSISTLSKKYTWVEIMGDQASIPLIEPIIIELSIRYLKKEVYVVQDTVYLMFLDDNDYCPYCRSKLKPFSRKCPQCKEWLHPREYRFNEMETDSAYKEMVMLGDNPDNDKLLSLTNTKYERFFVINIPFPGYIKDVYGAVIDSVLPSYSKCSLSTEIIPGIYLYNIKVIDKNTKQLMELNYKLLLGTSAY